MQIEYEKTFPFKKHKVVLYDELDFTEANIRGYINNGMCEYCDKIIVISKKQFDIVFRSLINNKE